MKNRGYIALFVVLVLATGYFVFTAGDSGPFPPVDNSVDYYYCSIHEGIYLDVQKHETFIYITQNGVWHSKEQKLVKFHPRHEEPYDWHKSPKKSEEKRFIEEQYLAWEEAYELERSNVANLRQSEKRIRVPKGENPYHWRPESELKSFAEYYDLLAKEGFRYSYFRDTTIYL